MNADLECLRDAGRACGPRCFHFVRHGATEANERKLRCGGDLDVALSERGREQARAAARLLRERQIEVGVIVCSSLERARETAAIIGSTLGLARIAVEPLLNERSLGAWNLLPVSDTEHLLASNVTPPGGECEAVFVARVEAAIGRLVPFLPLHPLVVSSKGVARVLNLLIGDGSRMHLANGEIYRFTLQRPALTRALERTEI